MQTGRCVYYDLTVSAPSCMALIERGHGSGAAQGLEEMLYLRMCFDRPDAGALRAERLKQHREYVASFIEGRGGIRIVQGGPMLDEAEAGYLGSFMIVEAESFAGFGAFHEADPFTRAGLFDTVHLIPWERHIGNDGAAPYVP